MERCCTDCIYNSLARHGNVLCKLHRAIILWACLRVTWFAFVNQALNAYSLHKKRHISFLVNSPLCIIPHKKMINMNTYVKHYNFIPLTLQKDFINALFSSSPVLLSNTQMFLRLTAVTDKKARQTVPLTGPGFQIRYECQQNNWRRCFICRRQRGMKWNWISEKMRRGANLRRQTHKGFAMFEENRG